MHFVCAQNHFQIIHLSCCSNSHWHSGFKRRSWAFGVLPEKYLIDMLHTLHQVSAHHTWSMILFWSMKLGGKKELKSEIRELSRLRVQANEKRSGAPASSCMQPWRVAVSLCYGMWEKFCNFKVMGKIFFWCVLMMWMCDGNDYYQDPWYWVFIDNEMKWEGPQLKEFNWLRVGNHLYSDPQENVRNSD